VGRYHSGVLLAAPICDIGAGMQSSAWCSEGQHQQPGGQPSAQDRRPGLHGGSAAAVVAVIENLFRVKYRRLGTPIRFDESGLKHQASFPNHRRLTTPGLLAEITAGKPDFRVALATIRHTTVLRVCPLLMPIALHAIPSGQNDAERHHRADTMKVQPFAAP
jgi:hypothetical protein